MHEILECLCLLFFIMFDVKLTPSGRSVDRRLFDEWVDGVQD